MKKLRSQFLLNLFRVLLFLFFIECFLFLGGEVFLAQQAYQNRKIFTGKEHAYRIMCVGDSNTIVGGKDSYPSQLQNILNQNKRNITFEVTNRGLPAATSSEIMQKLDQFIDEIKPHMIIVMMGANDRREETPLVNDSFLKSIISLFKDLKGYRFFQKMFDKAVNALNLSQAESVNNKFKIDFNEYRAEDKNYYRVPQGLLHKRKSVTPQMVQQLEEGQKLVKQNKHQEAQQALRDLLTTQNMDPQMELIANTELMNSLIAQEKYQELIKVWDHQFSFFSFNVEATNAIRQLCQENKATEPIRSLLLKKHNQHPDSMSYNGLLAECHSFWAEHETAARYYKKIQQLRMNGDILVLNQNYLGLADKIIKKDIKGVFVQYPMRDVRVLERIFKSFDRKNQFIFVDNQALFREAWIPDKYSKYFTDRNYFDLGHCTPYGNSILAENIANRLLGSYF